MQIIFDKGLDTQRAIEVDSFSENVGRDVLSASWTRVLKSDTAIPAVKTLTDNPTFTTVEVVDTDGETAFSIPVQGEYNTIRDVNVNYSSAQCVYNLTIVLVMTGSK